MKNTDSTKKTIRQITSISITKLFNLFDHKLPINTNERISIIYGPNGIGKTTILEIINNLFKSNFSYLYRIPFKKMEIKFNDNSTLRILKRTKKQNKINIYDKILFVEYNDPNKNKKTCKIPSLSKSDFPIHYLIRRNLPFLERISEDTWLNKRNNETCDLDYIFDNYLDLTENRMKKIDMFNFEQLSLLQKIPKWLIDLLESVSVYFIKSQRLFTMESSESARNKITDSVEKCSNDLVENINNARSIYTDVSQSLDRTFPVRLVRKLLLSKNKEMEYTKEGIINQIKKLEEERIRLMKFALLESKSDQDATFNVNNFPDFLESDTGLKQALQLYNEDTSKKLDTFAEIASKIELLKEIINKRFLHKEMDINKDEGFIFKLLGNKNRFLKLKNLSSGEQNVLVIQYELLFKTKPRSLILIDEPEISLHIDWQVQFLEDISKISKISDFDVLIATHSPQIINDRWDLTIPLLGEEK